MRSTLLVVVLFSCSMSWALEFDDESVDSATHWFESLRRQKWERTYEEIANVNFLRTKLIAVEHGLSKIRQSSSEVDRYCAAPQPNMTVCLERHDSAYGGIKALQNRLLVIQTSRELHKTLAQAPKLRKGLESLLAHLREKLVALAKDAEATRAIIGKQKAAADFDNYINEQNAAEEKSRLEIACQLRPITLTHEVNHLHALYQSGKSKDDPFVLVDSHKRSLDLSLEMTSLNSRCGTKTLAEQQKVLHKIAANDPYKSLQQVFAKACKKIKSRELATICKENIINDFTIAAIHSALVGAK